MLCNRIFYEKAEESDYIYIYMLVLFYNLNVCVYGVHGCEAHMHICVHVCGGPRLILENLS